MDSLYHRAVGYSYHTVKITKEGKQIPYLAHVPPDVQAQAMWLTNRRPGEWKNTKTVEVKDPRSEQELLDAIVTKFKNLRQLAAIEGEVVTPKLTNGHAKVEEVRPHDPWCLHLMGDHRRARCTCGANVANEQERPALDASGTTRKQSPVPDPVVPGQERGSD